MERNGYAQRDEIRQRWRQLNRRLWAGWENDRPIGTIEQGRRFTWIGPDGDQHPGFASLSDAQRAAARIGSNDRETARRDVGSRIVVAVGLVAAGSIFVVLGWLAGMVLNR